MSVRDVLQVCFAKQRCCYCRCRCHCQSSTATMTLLKLPKIKPAKTHYIILTNLRYWSAKGFTIILWYWGSLFRWWVNTDELKFTYMYIKIHLFIYTVYAHSEKFNIDSKFISAESSLLRSIIYVLRTKIHYRCIVNSCH